MKQLSITTDFVSDTGCPGPSLRKIADAGFSHVHWCHQWNTDFLYSTHEVGQIAKWLREYGLSLLDLHGSGGREKNWVTGEEYARLAGVELVLNRIEMTARLGGDAVVMHGGLPSTPDGTVPPWDMLRKSLDAIQPHADKLGVRIAIENCRGDWDLIRALCDFYPPDFLGICYDSGHGNFIGRGLDHLDTLKDRLVCVHLHDNDGTADQHRLPFTGTVDWPRLAGILSVSAYTKCISMEPNMRNEGIPDETEYLAKAFTACARLSDMVAGL